MVRSSPPLLVHKMCTQPRTLARLFLHQDLVVHWRQDPFAILARIRADLKVVSPCHLPLWLLRVAQALHSVEVRHHPL